MENSLVKSVIEICRTLNEQSVQYLIVGGTAVGFYGYYRGSTASDGSPLGKHDLDFWYNPILENYYKLLNAFENLGIDISKHRKGIAVPKQSFFRYEFDEYKTDFLPIIKGLEDFATSYRRKATVNLHEVTIPIISLEDLLKSKETDSRDKDIDDINKLKSTKQDPK
jgi:predicted nucleotidyltransferase